MYLVFICPRASPLGYPPCIKYPRLSLMNPEEILEFINSHKKSLSTPINLKCSTNFIPSTNENFLDIIWHPIELENNNHMLAIFCLNGETEFFCPNGYKDSYYHLPISNFKVQRKFQRANSKIVHLQ